MTNAWLWWEKWKASSVLEFLLNFRVRGQFEIKMLIALGLSDINTTYFIWIKKEPAIIWKLVTCQRITSEKIHDLDGSTPEPAIGSGDTGQQIPCFDSCQLLTTLMCNQWAPKVVRKCESKHWYACGADRRSLARSVYGHVITKFSGMGRLPHFLSYGAPPTRARFVIICVL